jgi:hypothetical protein
MSEIRSLSDRIDSEFAEAIARASECQKQLVRELEERQLRLVKFDAAVELFCTHWRPRLELLRQRFAELVKVNPVIMPHRRESTFSFTSEKYSIELRFSAGPDHDVRNLVLEYNLRIIPMLIKFESHNEMVVPLDQIDEEAVASWLDERILAFVRTYVALQGDTFVQDHLAKNTQSKVDMG